MRWTQPKGKMGRFSLNRQICGFVLLAKICLDKNIKFLMRQSSA